MKHELPLLAQTRNLLSSYDPAVAHIFAEINGYRARGAEAGGVGAAHALSLSALCDIAAENDFPLAATMRSIVDRWLSVRRPFCLLPGGRVGFYVHNGVMPADWRDEIRSKLFVYYSDAANAKDTYVFVGRSRVDGLLNLCFTLAEIHGEDVGRLSTLLFANSLAAMKADSRRTMTTDQQKMGWRRRWRDDAAAYHYGRGGRPPLFGPEAAGLLAAVCDDNDPVAAMALADIIEEAGEEWLARAARLLCRSGVRIETDWRPNDAAATAPYARKADTADVYVSREGILYRINIGLEAATFGKKFYFLREGSYPDAWWAKIGAHVDISMRVGLCRRYEDGPTLITRTLYLAEADFGEAYCVLVRLLHESGVTQILEEERRG